MCHYLPRYGLNHPRASGGAVSNPNFRCAPGLCVRINRHESTGGYREGVMYVWPRLLQPEPRID